MSERVLITGASGLIGRELISQLLDKGHEVAVLSRKPAQNALYKTYTWDIDAGRADAAALEGVTAVIHLAGEAISKGPWTEAQKRRVIDSRVKSANLLHALVKSHGRQVTHFISASGVGFYGDCGDELLTERSPAGRDFMARCCVAWEQAAMQFKELGLRVSVLRTGVVLAEQGGALPTFALPVKLFAAAPLGSGRQWIPWLHLDDAAAAYAYLLENPHAAGIYNLCAPFPVTNKGLTRALAKQLHRPVWPFHVPRLVLKLALGERSVLPLSSTNTSAQKLLDVGFLFKFTNLQDALASIYERPPTQNNERNN
ncbi:TIGR01777 family protein [Pedobacter yulinensis]|uniref:TIGR01777 family protein n=1 Tax=Pedobacter yulinensis TaxID=2126353 RepID=A0A2T3HPN7_9SPHI|nr:TIGR01777 family oxidoreductase [Pedobacter yulinensis]PST84367.1 TIGR01777 family protein [Pedobacter yulinensis]